ncbi:MAG: hypothetical protein J5715_03930 [Clostridiales bacterium]|nr:hypothetical protein [Clostridiales bacterium]
MGRVINISNKLDREPRFLIVDDTHKYKVDCTKNAVLKVMDLDSDNDAAQLDEILKILLGAKALKEIEDMQLPYDNWVTIVKAAIAVATNKDFDDVDAEFRGEETAG